MAYRVFIDANVYLDFLLQRSNEWQEAKSLFKLAETGAIEILTSSSIVLNLMYIMGTQKIRREEIIAYTETILKYSTLKDPDNHTFISALHAGFSDLEDAVQYHTALHIKGLNYFITSNIKDFKKATSQLQVLTPKQFIKKYKT